MAEDNPTPIQPDDDQPKQGGEWLNLQGADLGQLINNLSREQAVQVLHAYRENMMPQDEDFMAFIINNQNNDGHGSFESEFNFNNCFTCICADCGQPAPEVLLTAGIDGTSEPWANCPNCNEITGVEFDSQDLPSCVNGEGSNYDFQFQLRHFGEHHTPDIEQVVQCLRYEAENPFNGCPTCQDLRGAEVRINSLDEVACPDIKTQCVECVEIEMCECTTTDMGGRCVDCLRLVGAGRGDF